MRVVCLIPARKGSLGLRRKNLRLVGCFTLVNRAIRVAKRVEPSMHIILSSDDETILKRYGKKVDVCIKRKAQLSTSDALISDVISDALQQVKGFTDNDILVLLEPSSPNRTSRDISSAIDVMIKNNYQSIVTVSAADSKYHPYKLLKSTEDLYLIPFVHESPLIYNRQQITEPAYFRNGLAYLYRLSTARKLSKPLPDGTRFIVTERLVSNIDTELDLWIARYIHFKNLFIKFAIKKI